MIGLSGYSACAIDAIPPMLRVVANISASAFFLVVFMDTSPMVFIDAILAGRRGVVFASLRCYLPFCPIILIALLLEATWLMH